jgi:hypothetical protein
MVSTLVPAIREPQHYNQHTKVIVNSREDVCERVIVKIHQNGGDRATSSFAILWSHFSREKFESKYCSYVGLYDGMDDDNDKRSS